jgi:hypothetical protein
VLHLVTIHANLVTSDNSLKTVLLTELLGNVRTKLHTNTTLAGPSAVLLLRVGPEHLHHQASLTGLSLAVSVQFSDIVKSDTIIGEETSMKDKVLLANECSQSQSGKTLREQLEDSLVVLGLAFTLETIDSVHVVCLVVSTVQEELLRSQPLVSIQEQSDLSRPRTSIHKVTVKKIPVLLIRGTVTAEQFHKIEVLTYKD